MAVVVNAGCTWRVRGRSHRLVGPVPTRVGPRGCDGVRPGEGEPHTRSAGRRRPRGGRDQPGDGGRRRSAARTGDDRPGGGHPGTLVLGRSDPPAQRGRSRPVRARRPGAGPGPVDVVPALVHRRQRSDPGLRPQSGDRPRPRRRHRRQRGSQLARRHDPARPDQRHGPPGRAAGVGATPYRHRRRRIGRADLRPRRHRHPDPRATRRCPARRRHRRHRFRRRRHLGPHGRRQARRRRPGRRRRRLRSRLPHRRWRRDERGVPRRQRHPRIAPSATGSTSPATKPPAGLRVRTQVGAPSSRSTTCGKPWPGSAGERADRPAPSREVRRRRRCGSPARTNASTRPLGRVRTRTSPESDRTDPHAPCLSPTRGRR